MWVNRCMFNSKYCLNIGITQNWLGFIHGIYKIDATNMSLLILRVILNFLFMLAMHRMSYYILLD